MKSFKDTMSEISSKTADLNLKNPVDVYGKFLYRNLSKTVKFIAYVVAVITLIIGVVAAFLISKSHDGFLAVAIGLFLAFAVIAFIEFFIIYGIGHIIDQNNEILKKLN